MDKSKGLSAIAYLSIFFAPFIVPVFLFFASKEQMIRAHAKRAFISHLIPIILGIFFLLFFFGSAFYASNTTFFDGNTIFMTAIFFILYLLLSFGIAIWNLVQAIKVLR